MILWFYDRHMGHCWDGVRWRAGPWRQCGRTGRPGVGLPLWAAYAAPRTQHGMAEGHICSAGLWELVDLSLLDRIDFVGPSPLVMAVLTPLGPPLFPWNATWIIHHVGTGFQIQGLPWFYLGSSLTVFGESPLACFLPQQEMLVTMVLYSGQQWDMPLHQESSACTG